MPSIAVDGYICTARRTVRARCWYCWVARWQASCESARRPGPQLLGVAHCPDVGDPVVCDVEREHRDGDAVLLGCQAGLAVDRALQHRHVAGCSGRQLGQVARDLLGAFSYAQGQDQDQRQNAASLREGRCGSPEDNPVNNPASEPCPTIVEEVLGAAFCVPAWQSGWCPNGWSFRVACNRQGGVTVQRVTGLEMPWTRQRSPTHQCLGASPGRRLVAAGRAGCHH